MRQVRQSGRTSEGGRMDRKDGRGQAFRQAFELLPDPAALPRAGQRSLPSHSAQAERAPSSHASPSARPAYRRREREPYPRRKARCQ